MEQNIFAKYNTSAGGLTDEQVAKSREQHGTNELEKQKRKPFLVRFLLQFKNLMVIVLLLSATISLIINVREPGGGNIFEAVIIFVIVIVNAFIGVLQEQKAEDAIEKLKKQTSPKAVVTRGGKELVIDTSELVAGDVVHIKNGDFCPADIVLSAASSLKCNESTLTGESDNIEKFAAVGDKITDKNMCFSGTIITSGSGTGIVIATGKNAKIGKIAGLINNSKKEKTPLENTIDQIGKVITISVLIISALVFAIELLFSKRLNMLDSFMVAVALAVAAIPESLPAVITIIMALGVEKLAKHNAIIKNLSSVETLGCCNYLCSDKTGTLTENKMTVTSIYVSGKKPSTASKLDEFSKQILCLCTNAKVNNDKIIGDATETAILNYISPQININVCKQTCKRLAEVPFNSKDKKMSTLNLINGEPWLIMKGAMDYILPFCSNIEIDGKQVPASKELLKNLELEHSKMASRGERVIAFAVKQTSNIEDCSGLTLKILVGITDPPRKEVISAIKTCKRAHMKPVMITGDHPETAFAISKQLGLAKSYKEVLTGEQMHHLSDEKLLQIIDSLSVFARVTPEDKNRLVRLLQKKGNIVAMTGDGANDAPSVKQADIGVCMGSGSDVTKSVADLVLSDNNFTSIVLAVKQGRTIYANLRKTLQFLISTNAVEVICIFVSSLLIRDAAMLLPSQLLFINLITDSLPAFALGLEKPEKNIMDAPPRKSSESIFAGNTGWHILLQAFVQSLLVLTVFTCTCHAYGNMVASTICFLIICFMQIIHAINCKTNQSVFKIKVFNNPAFNISFVVLMLSIVGVSTIAPLQKMFSLTSLNLTQWLITIIASISIIPLVELTKLIVNGKKKENLIHRDLDR